MNSTKNAINDPNDKESKCPNSQKITQSRNIDTETCARPQFPQKAVVTAGMPYGNKGLHFGHIGGVFVPADIYARFLRDRIGEHNVLFVCGTDCYGSPIVEGYRKLVEDKSFVGTIDDYVQMNHESQARTLKNYAISLDVFEGSGLGKSKAIHKSFSDDVLERLHYNHHLTCISTEQFYDKEAKSFLNGRQVLGRCPIPGCKSEFAYADECDQGHQYMPKDLIEPKSALTGIRPEMRMVKNWYFDLPNYREILKELVAAMRTDGQTREVVSNTMSEFLVAPILYVKNEFEDSYFECKDSLPTHIYRAAEKGKASFELEFNDLEQRDAARIILDEKHMRYRAGKALVPFRMTGNIDWGVPALPLDGVMGLTVWVWPESLWAPISFTRAYIDNNGEGIETLNPLRREVASLDMATDWRDYWCSTNSEIYQFIGQDNIYFYGVAQSALRTALPTLHSPQCNAEPGEIRQSKIIANYHLQFLGKKASSSSAVKPPMADELLNYYTPEQLRAHFMSLGLGLRPASFQPKPLNPLAADKEADPVLKEGTLLTNVFNRLARSCFYTAQKDNANMMPLGRIDTKILTDAKNTILEYERLMFKYEFHVVSQLLADFIRKANKYWSDAITAAGDDTVARINVLRNTFYLLRVCTVLMHPIVPQGTEMIFDYLNLEDTTTKREFFSWDHIFDDYEDFVSSIDNQRGGHPIKILPPRTDFFERHPSQY